METFTTKAYRSLILGLNYCITVTDQLQKSQLNISKEYKDALELQLELEKVKLSVMQKLGDDFYTQIKEKVEIAEDSLGRPIYEYETVGDVRFSNLMDVIQNLNEEID